MRSSHGPFGHHCNQMRAVRLRGVGVSNQLCRINRKIVDYNGRKFI